MKNPRNVRGAALPEVIVATVLLATGGLGALALVHHIVLQERLHSRQVLLYWQSETVNARLQLLGPPPRERVVRWSSAAGSARQDCEQSAPTADRSIATVVEDWSHQLSCLLPTHRGRVEASADKLSIFVRWPRAGSAGNQSQPDPDTVWRELERHWRWTH